MIIVGGGIIGLSCAWRLAQRGLAVTVFDAAQVGGEASWAGAGMLAPGGEIDGESPIAAMAMRSLSQFPDFVRELQNEVDLPIDYRRSGAIEVALSDVESEALTIKSARQAAIGIRSEVCRYNGLSARHYPDDAIVDPRDVTRALAEACRRRGVTIREHEPVTSIAKDGATVRTRSGEYGDQGVLIAAGAWSGPLVSGLPATMPVRGHLISWDLEPGVLQPILRRGHTYLLQRRSGTLVAGSSTEHTGFDRGIDESVVAGIRARASLLLPMLGTLEPTAKWVGLRPGIEADRPAIGRIPGTSIWTAFGHYRNGILLAPETARMIADSFC